MYFLIFSARIVRETSSLHPIFLLCRSGGGSGYLQNIGFPSVNWYRSSDYPLNDNWLHFIVIHVCVNVNTIPSGRGVGVCYTKLVNAKITPTFQCSSSPSPAPGKPNITGIPSQNFWRPALCLSLQAVKQTMQTSRYKQPQPLHASRGSCLGQVWLRLV